MEPKEVLDMCDHAKLDEQLDTYLATRRFAEWIPDPAEAETLSTALRQFAHELAYALDEDSPEKQTAPPLRHAAETAGRINAILQSRRNPLTVTDFDCFEPETKILLWDEADIIDTLLPREQQISPNWLESNLCRIVN